MREGSKFLPHLKDVCVKNLSIALRGNSAPCVCLTCLTLVANFHVLSSLTTQSNSHMTEGLGLLFVNEKSEGLHQGVSTRSVL